MIYEVVDVPQNNPCFNCNPCMRMRLMEMGFISGAKIDVEEKMSGMYIVKMVSIDGFVEQTVGLRKEELDRVCYKLK